MKTFSDYLKEDYPSWVIPNGTPVSWDYRGTKGYGHIVSVETLGKTNADTSYKVSPSDRRFHPGEPEFRTHTGADITRSTDDAIKAHIDQLEKEQG